MNERAHAYIAGIRKTVLQQRVDQQSGSHVVDQVLTLGKTLRALSKPDVGDPARRTLLEDRASQLATGLVEGPAPETLIQTETILDTLDPEVADKVREHILFTAYSLSKFKR
jgi:hypothetical protein